MGRKKMKLAFIMNNSARKSSYNERKKSLLKKVSELSTLCGVYACAIIFSKYNPEPQVWPSTLGVQRVLALFSRVPEMEKTRNMFNQENFLRQSIAKVKKKLEKLQMANRQKEIAFSLFQTLLAGKERLQTLPLQDLIDLGRKIEPKLNEINKRVEAIKSMAPQLQVVPPPPLLPPSQPLPQPPPTISSNQMQEWGKQLQLGIGAEPFASIVRGSDQSPH